MLVIANGCSDSVARQVASDCSRRAGVRLHRSDRNLGAAGGRRLGAELAAAELVLFLDDDAELMPGALAHLVAHLDEHPSAGAVTATVVAPDGSVLHCGGTMEVSAELVTFTLSGFGVAVDSASVPPSGPTAWVPGTAVLIRRSLLTEFELDERMSAYYEDNEWCYRVSRDRPDAFRRCRQALAIHHLGRRQLGERTPEGRALTVRMLTAHARFYERHGLLLAPWLFDVVPELRAADGTCDLASARLLLEIFTAKVLTGPCRRGAMASSLRCSTGRGASRTCAVRRSRSTRLRPKALSGRPRSTAYARRSPHRRRHSRSCISATRPCVASRRADGGDCGTASDRRCASTRQSVAPGDGRQPATDARWRRCRPRTRRVPSGSRRLRIELGGRLGSAQSSELDPPPPGLIV